MSSWSPPPRHARFGGRQRERPPGGTRRIVSIDQGQGRVMPGAGRWHPDRIRTAAGPGEQSARHAPPAGDQPPPGRSLTVIGDGVADALAPHFAPAIGTP